MDTTPQTPRLAAAIFLARAAIALESFQAYGPADDMQNADGLGLLPSFESSATLQA